MKDDYDLVGTTVIEGDATTRFRLHRIVGILGSRGTVLFVMLNPSTADDYQDDPTIRRCIKFALNWGYNNLEVVNLFPHRATRPRDLRSVDCSAANETAIINAAAEAQMRVAAWGHPQLHYSMREEFWFRSHRVLELMKRFGPVYCLGKTARLQPRHPLYVRSNRTPEEI